MKEGSNSKAILSPPVEDRTEHEAPEGERGASGKKSCIVTLNYAGKSPIDLPIPYMDPIMVFPYPMDPMMVFP